MLRTKFVQVRGWGKVFECSYFIDLREFQPNFFWYETFGCLRRRWADSWPPPLPNGQVLVDLRWPAQAAQEKCRVEAAIVAAREPHEPGALVGQRPQVSVRSPGAHWREVVRDTVAADEPGDQASRGRGRDQGIGSCSVIAACGARYTQQQDGDAYWTMPNNLFRSFLLSKLECEMQKDVEMILGWERGAEAT